MKKLFCLSLILLSVSFSQGVVAQMEKGSVNYSEQTISAIGIGFVPTNAVNAGQARRMALRIAKQDALRQLIEIVNGVTLTSETTMSGAMVDDVINRFWMIIECWIWWNNMCSHHGNFSK